MQVGPLIFYVVRNILVGKENSVNKNPFDFTLELTKGKTLDLSAHKGKPMLVVNTATKCGLAPQFESLEDLHEDYGPRGLLVLGMPSNQFANQEPVGDADMVEACKVGYGVTFPLTRKVDVNGPGTHPLMALLKEMAPGMLGKRDLSWNFTKFLVWPDGSKVKRYAPTTLPSSIRKDIEKLLPA